MSNKINFKFRGREGVICPKIQVDVLSYEPLHKRIERFLSGDASSLEGADSSKSEYDEPEKTGIDDSIFEPEPLRDDVLNQPLDSLDIAELKCDSQKSLTESYKKLDSMKKQKQENQATEQKPATEQKSATEQKPATKQNSVPDKKE